LSQHLFVSGDVQNGHTRKGLCRQRQVFPRTIDKHKLLRQSRQLRMAYPVLMSIGLPMHGKRLRSQQAFECIRCHAFMGLAIGHCGPVNRSLSPVRGQMVGQVRAQPSQ